MAGPAWSAVRVLGKLAGTPCHPEDITRQPRSEDAFQVIGREDTVDGSHPPQPSRPSVRELVTEHGAQIFRNDHLIPTLLRMVAQSGRRWMPAKFAAGRLTRNEWQLVPRQATLGR